MLIMNRIEGINCPILDNSRLVSEFIEKREMARKTLVEGDLSIAIESLLASKAAEFALHEFFRGKNSESTKMLTDVQCLAHKKPTLFHKPLVTDTESSNSIKLLSNLRKAIKYAGFAAFQDGNIMARCEAGGLEVHQYETGYFKDDTWLIKLFNYSLPFPFSDFSQAFQPYAARKLEIDTLYCVINQTKRGDIGVIGAGLIGRDFVGRNNLNGFFLVFLAEYQILANNFLDLFSKNPRKTLTEVLNHTFMKSAVPRGKLDLRQPPSPSTICSYPFSNEIMLRLVDNR